MNEIYFKTIAIVWGFCALLNCIFLFHTVKRREGYINVGLTMAIFILSFVGGPVALATCIYQYCIKKD